MAASGKEMKNSEQDAKIDSLFKDERLIKNCAVLLIDAIANGNAEVAEMFCGVYKERGWKGLADMVFPKALSVSQAQRTYLSEGHRLALQTLGVFSQTSQAGAVHQDSKTPAVSACKAKRS